MKLGIKLGHDLISEHIQFLDEIFTISVNKAHYHVLIMTVRCYLRATFWQFSYCSHTLRARVKIKRRKVLDVLDSNSLLVLNCVGKVRLNLLLNLLRVLCSYLLLHLLWKIRLLWTLLVKKRWLRSKRGRIVLLPRTELIHSGLRRCLLELVLLLQDLS